jgi:molybdenum cofactor synthesis domain-containing protein
MTMKPFEKLVSRLEATRIIDANVNHISRMEDVPLEEAPGRVLAANVTAEFNVPPFRRASMDGYGVKAKDTMGASESKPRRLTLIGVTHAGESIDISVRDDECVEIATGSPLPKGTDAVVMVEYTRLSGNTVEIVREARLGENVADEGEDIKSGEIVAKAGEVLTPGKLGAAAALGLTTLKVYAKPRVGIYSTGNEIVPQGGTVKPGQIYDINSCTLTSIAQMSGCIPVRKGLVADDLQELLATAKEVAACDIAVFSGGSSVGSKDLLAAAVEEIGVVHFHGLQVKPGKPTLFGTVQGKPVFGMPGNPTSCLTNAYVFLIPALRKIAGLPSVEMRRVRAILSSSISADGEREVFYPVRVEGERAVPVFRKGSNITSISYANGLVIIPTGTKRIEKGAEVEVNLLP